jgi:hypothetical protein
MWQALETKARFIGQVMTSDSPARRAEDIGGQEATPGGESMRRLYNSVNPAKRSDRT